MRIRRTPMMTLLMALFVGLFTIALVWFPKPGFDAGLSGLKIFLDVVFPSLLPFFILSDLMLGLGLVRALGVFLEPLMRPLFNVPGVGAFALSMGLAAGYPMDAVITARLRENGDCTRIEGERLLAFTNTADPLFMFGAVAVGMFKSPELGMLFALAHYLSAFIVGVSFRFYGRHQEIKRPRKMRLTIKHDMSIWKRAYLEMIKSRAEDGRPFGRLLGDAVSESVRTLLMIGGFIMFFSVFLRVLSEVGFVGLITPLLAVVFQLLHLNQHLILPMINGIFEIDIGSASTAQVAAPLIQKVSMVSAIIAWSGLSVHAQVASVLTKTDIRMRPYFLARFYHAIVAGGITFLLFNTSFLNVAAGFFPRSVYALAPLQTAPISLLQTSYVALATGVLVLTIALIVSFIIYVLTRLKMVFWFINGGSR